MFTSLLAVGIVWLLVDVNLTPKKEKYIESLYLEIWREDDNGQGEKKCFSLLLF